MNTEEIKNYEVEVEISIALLQEFFNGQIPVLKDGMEAGELYRAVVTFSYRRRPADHQIAVDGIHYESDLIKKIVGMKGRVIREGWKEGTKPVHTYYLTQRPPGPGTYPVHTSTDPEELTIEAYGKRTVYKLSYADHLTQKEVARYELLPALPDSVREGSYYPLSFAGSEGKLMVEKISEDRTEVTVWEDWEGVELPVERSTYNVNGLLKEYPKIFFYLVYPHEYPVRE